ncbi:MAG: hypothetical protein HC933_20030 [Pleurocapsa sp. SU_196_0]|nr:hypothetical protein [Pleurocapsa sp. SU_196_0]
MKNLTLNDLFNPTVNMPEDGLDRRTAASLESGRQALANRTQWLHNRLNPLSPVPGEVRDFVKRNGVALEAGSSVTRATRRFWH